MTLITQIKHIMTAENISQSALAKEVGYTSAVLSAYFSDSYKGDNSAVTNALNQWLQNRQKKAQLFVEPPQFIETPTAKKVFTALDVARICKTIVPIYGASGVGKTKAAQEYTKGYQNVWLITISPSRASLSAFLYELALELGIKDAPRRKDTLSRLISEKIKGTEGLIIVDESDHLTYDALEELRYLQEKAEIGFALIGNDKVYTKMQGGINQAHEYARLWTRLGKNTPIKASTKSDIKAIAEAWQLDSQDKDLMKVLYDIGGNAGGLRALNQYLRLAAMTAKGNGTAISLDLILTAQAQMKGGN